MIRQAADDVLCCAVRQATDDGLDLLPVNFLMGNKGGERCWCEMGENFIHLFAGVGVCHKCCYFNIGVVLSQSNKVSARIAGGANDGSSDDLVRGLVGHAGGSFWVLCSMRSLLFFAPGLRVIGLAILCSTIKKGDAICNALCCSVSSCLLNAWRTGSCAGLLPYRISYAQPHGCHV